MRGNCLCGEVEFEIVGEAPRLYQCHCSLCRKQSGSTSNSSLLIESESFRWLGGEDRISSYVKEFGFPVRLLLSVWVPRPQSPPEHKVCLGPKRFTGRRYSTGSRCPCLCRFESLLGCDPRRRHAVRTLAAGPKNPSSMPETPVTRPSLRFGECRGQAVVTAGLQRWQGGCVWKKSDADVFWVFWSANPGDIGTG